MKEKKEINKVNIKALKKIGGLLSVILISISVLTGVGFGFYKSVKSNPGTDNSYNNKVKITAHVDIDKDSGKTIKDAAKYIQDTFEFLGMKNSTVSTVGDDTVMITSPVTSYDHTNNDDYSSVLEMMENSNNNSNYVKEIANIILPIFINGTIDFRTVNGDPIFGMDSNGQYRFLSENMELPDASNPDITTPEVDNYVAPYETTTPPGDFYTDAKVVQVNGKPVIEIGIKDHGNDNAAYINMFKDFDAWLFSNSINVESSTGSSEYMIYFNFNSLSKALIEYVDVVTDITNVDDYILTNSKLRPLYITSSSSSLMASKFDDKIQISGDFNDKQADYFVSKINNGSAMRFNNFSISMSMNEISKVILLVMAIILLLIIIIIIFSFVSYFGLLGVITSIGFLLTTLFMALIFSASGLTLSGIILGSLIFSVFISAYMFYHATDMYKKNNQDKFISTTTRFLSKYKEINKSLFFSIFSLVVIIYVSALMLPIVVTLPLYLIAITIVLSYVTIAFLFIPLVYFYDYLLEFSKEENNKKWFWMDGFNNEIKIKLNFEVKGIKQKTFAMSLTGIIVLLLSLIIGGAIFASTGSSANINLYGTNNYIYNVKLIDGQAIDMEEEPYNVNISYEAANDKSDEVEKSFKDAGIKVNNIETIRFDEISKDDGGLESTFGFQITSTSEVTNESMNTINEKLPEEYSLINGTSENGYDGMSLINGQSEKIISYTENNIIISALLSLLVLIFSIALIILLISNWGVSLAAIVSTMLESVFIITPIFILFIPYNLLIWFPIFIFLSISGALKIMVSQEVKREEIKKNKWSRVSKKKILLIPLIAIILLFIELLMIGSYGFLLILPLILITIFAPMIIFIVQQFVFPYFAEILGDFRDKVKENKLKDDIKNSQNSKENGKSKEEMIDGVNM